MGEKASDAAAAAVGDQDDGQAAAGVLALDGIQYCSEHPYRPGAAAAAVAGGGICAFCLQEKLGRLVSSSKSSPFFPPGGHPPPSASPSSPPSFRRAAAEPPLPPHHSSAGSRKFIPFQRKKNSSSASASTLSASMAGGGLKRSKSVAPRPEEQHYSSFSTAESPRKKSFWSFLYLSSSSSAYAHQQTASSSSSSVSSYTTTNGAGARRKSVSVASAAWASRAGAGAQQDQQLRSSAARRMEAIGEPESLSQVSSSSSSFGRKVARSRSVGCGSRSFSGDFLDRISFGDCTLRRVESQREREPKASKMRAALGRHLGADEEDDDDDVYEHRDRIKCAGFFGGMGPTSSSYWLSAAEGTRKRGGSRSHRSWAWALASPMRALRPTSSTSTKIITAEPSGHVVVSSSGDTPAAALSISSPMPSSSDVAAATAMD